MARLLNTYQLWLDDLFPKAKFMDGISMIEKLGHKKRMQMMRREWIQEGKPKPPRDDEEEDFVIPDENAVPENNNAHNNEEQPSNAEPRSEAEPKGGAQGRDNHNPFGEEEPDEDELDALLAESETVPLPATRQNNTRPAEDQEPDEDELDALMAEDAMNDSVPKSIFGGPVSSTTATNTSSRPRGQFDDDEEAMAGMDW